MPNGHEEKEYGEHKYDDDHDRISNCIYRCGCWIGPVRSGGPTGLDPFGCCPNNPKDGITAGGTADYDNVVTARINDLQKRLNKATSELPIVTRGEVALLEELEFTLKKLSEKNRILAGIRDLLGDFDVE